MHDVGNDHGLVRELGLREGLAIGLGTMIGAGIFVLSGVAAERAGPAATISYILTGLVCLPIAMVVSELATGMPKAGGSYTFITQALGPLAGAVVGPGNWLGLTFATSFYLIAFGEYLSFFVPVIPPWAGAAAGGLFFTFINYRGAKVSGSVQNLVVILLLVILVAFISAGLFNIDPALHRPFMPHGWGATVRVIGLIIVSYTGFEKISTISEEIKNPSRNLPLAIVGSVIIATIIYTLILFVTTGLLSHNEIGQSEAPLIEGAGRIVGLVGSMVMLLAALLATLSSANAAILASSRINYGMGRDRVLPDWFGYIHPKLSTPSHSILVTGGLATLLALIGQAEILAEISSALFMVSYALLCMSVIVMRHTRPRWYHPAFRVPFYPVLPIVAGLLALGVIMTMDTLPQITGIGLVGLSLVWYTVWVRKQAVVTGEFGPMWDRERPLEGIIEAAQAPALAGKKEILIPVFADTELEPLLKLATALARADDQRVVSILDVQVVPAQTPLHLAEAQFRHLDKPRGEVLAQVTAQGAALGVPIRTLHRVAHGAASCVLAIAESRPAVGLILTSWLGPLSAGQIYGSPSKTVLQEARCNVAVLRARGLKTVRRVLVPASGGGPHARLGLRLAADIASASGAALTVMRVVRPSSDLDLETEIRYLNRMVEEMAGGTISEVRSRIIVHESVLEGILREAREGDYDLMVIGASNEWAIKSLLVGALPDAVADRAPCSVLMVRRYEPTGLSTLRRVIGSIRGWT